MFKPGKNKKCLILCLLTLNRKEMVNVVDSLDVVLNVMFITNNEEVNVDIGTESKLQPNEAEDSLLAVGYLRISVGKFHQERQNSLWGGLLNYLEIWFIS